MKKIISLLVSSIMIIYCAGQSVVTPDWLIKVNDPSNYIPVALANGRIGIVPSEKLFTVESVILNNVYDRESEYGVSRILKGLNFLNTALWIDGEKVDNSNCTEWEQTLNMKEAFLETTFNYKGKAEVSYRIYALRNQPFNGLMDVYVKPLTNIKIKAEGIISAPENYKVVYNGFKILKDNEIRMPLLQTFADSPFGKHRLASSGSFVFNHKIPQLQHVIHNEREHGVSFERELVKGETYNFGWEGAICTSKDFSDPENESERLVIYLMRGNKEKAINDHKKSWEELWSGDIIVEGDPVSQQDIRLALYNLYSFSRQGSDLSIPPMGLSSQIYNGHIFWDAELWMLPPIMVFHPEIAVSALNYRFDRLDKACLKAQLYGFKGAMYPWESDDTGEEATPPFALTGTFEHHITADIGIAFWNYFRITGDKEWLATKGFPVIKEVADFWVSRATKNEDGSWSINNVVGANEFAPNVNDNAFTNGSAKAVLQYATEAAITLGKVPPAEWKSVAEKLRFNYLPGGVMMEHSKYNGEVIKQADVNLLAYPLQIVTDSAQIRSDVEYYEKRISPEGPAMSHSILSILHSRLGNSDLAFKLFTKGYYPNKRPPFGAIAETPQFNNTYFATGAGGLLQAVIFGFAGLNITNDGIIQTRPCLPPHWKKLTITGVGKDKRTYTFTAKDKL